MVRQKYRGIEQSEESQGWGARDGTMGVVL